MNPIENAVNPLKDQAIERAVQIASQRIMGAYDKLKGVEWNLDIAAPMPKGTDTKGNYLLKQAYRAFVKQITTATQASYMPNDPHTVRASETGVQQYIKETRKEAAAQYEAFVAKLISKIGEVVEATLEGDHVWSHSILTVKKSDGTTERWKTQMIVNISSLGKIFNQWPTRKLK